MRVVVVAPHPDDEAIGCGGAIALHADAGDRVDVVFLTSGELALEQLSRDEAWRVREAEAAASAEVLGIAGTTFLRLPDWFVSEHEDAASDALSGTFADEPPGRLYVPHGREWHPDHQAAWRAATAAVSGCGLSPYVLHGYEVWTPLAAFDVVEDVSDVMERKLEAIRRYESQTGAFDYVQAARGLGAYRGAMAAHRPYAEVFQMADDEAGRGAELSTARSAS